MRCRPMTSACELRVRFRRPMRSVAVSLSASGSCRPAKRVHPARVNRRSLAIGGSHLTQTQEKRLHHRPCSRAGRNITLPWPHVRQHPHHPKNGLFSTQRDPRYATQPPFKQHATRDLQLACFDGSSSAKAEGGTPDAQDILLWRWLRPEMARAETERIWGSVDGTAFRSGRSTQSAPCYVGLLGRGARQ
ncbi:hypothetical protein BC834DRAFT_529797 [Gloeopeniophorella convolvens]|nr:hypothetical protein BC834DRAFT_529797 [Gloeopeniophorella convolvens]